MGVTTCITIAPFFKIAVIINVAWPMAFCFVLVSFISVYCVVWRQCSFGVPGPASNWFLVVANIVTKARFDS